MCMTHSESGQPRGDYPSLASENARLKGYRKVLEDSCDRMKAQLTRAMQSLQDAARLIAMKKSDVSRLTADYQGLMDTHHKMCALRDIQQAISKQEISRLEAENAALAADIQKHKDRRQYFEDLLNRSIEHEQEWTQRAIKAEAENAALRQELANLKSGHGVRESIEELEDMDHMELVGAYMATSGVVVAADHENQKLRQERDEAVKLLRECLPFVEAIEGEDCGERADAFLDKLEGRHG